MYFYEKIVQPLYYLIMYEYLKEEFSKYGFIK
jgi:hypothetical protein